MSEDDAITVGSLDAIARRHWPITIDGMRICGRDEGIWPCDAARLLVAVETSHVEGLIEGARLEYLEHRSWGGDLDP